MENGKTSKISLRVVTYLGAGCTNFFFQFKMGMWLWACFGEQIVGLSLPLLSNDEKIECLFILYSLYIIPKL